MGSSGLGTAVSGSLDVRSVLVGTLAFLLAWWVLRRRTRWWRLGSRGRRGSGTMTRSGDETAAEAARRLPLPPGPPGWPLLGNLPALALASGAGRHPHEMFLRMAAEHGPVFRLNILGQRVVVVHGYKAIREAFNNASLSDRPELHILRNLFNGAEGVATASGETWKEQRKLILNVFKSFGVGRARFEDQIAAEAGYLVTELAGLGGGAFNPVHLFANAVSNVISSVVLGRRYEYADPEFQRVLAAMDRSMELIGAGAAMQFLPLVNNLGFVPCVREMTTTMKYVMDFVMGVVREHQARGADSSGGAEAEEEKEEEERAGEGDPRDLMDVYLGEMERKRAAGAPSHLSVTNLVVVVSDLFVAGTETTASTLRWALLFMMLRPDVQERVQDELDAVVGRQRLPRMSDRRRLPYTEAVILELQRRGNIVPLGLPHKAAEDTSLAGFRVPKGCLVVANLWALNIDPELFPDPWDFKPERFLSDDGEVVKPEELIPFSTGRRICLGEQLAKMELFIFFTYLLHRFTFTRPEGAPPHSFEGQLGITLAPAPFQVCAVPR